MRRVFAPIVIIAIALLVVASPRPATAEWSADAFLGFGSTSNTDLTFTSERTSRTLTLKDVEFDGGMVLGARGGYWLAGSELLGGLARYLGAGFEVAYSRHEIASQRPATDFGTARLASLGIDLFTLTPLAMARYPLLVSSEYPQGRPQPYAMLGPTIFITRPRTTGRSTSRSTRTSSPSASRIGFDGCG